MPVTPASMPPPKVLPFVQVRDRPGAEAAIEAIFFEASGRTFTPGREHDVFRERWLGRFLVQWPELAFVLEAAPSDPSRSKPEIAGYLVGCLDNPAKSPHFSDLAYFQVFAEVCARFPAHVHINLDRRFQGLGHGQLLIEAFACVAKAAGSPGVHVVTGDGARNIGFYGRSGFGEVAKTNWNGHEIVFLGRPLI